MPISDWALDNHFATLPTVDRSPSLSLSLSLSLSHMPLPKLRSSDSTHSSGLSSRCSHDRNEKEIEGDMEGKKKGGVRGKHE